MKTRIYTLGKLLARYPDERRSDSVEEIFNAARSASYGTTDEPMYLLNAEIRLHDSQSPSVHGVAPNSLCDVPR